MPQDKENEQGGRNKHLMGEKAPVWGQGIWEASTALPLSLWVTWTSALCSIWEMKGPDENRIYLQDPIFFDSRRQGWPIWETGPLPDGIPMSISNPYHWHNLSHHSWDGWGWKKAFGFILNGFRHGLQRPWGFGERYLPISVISSTTLSTSQSGMPAMGKWERYTAVLSNRNGLWATSVIWNVLAATVKM